MIEPPGTHPEDCDARPQYPLTPQIMLTVEERTEGQMTATAWAVGTDCSRCTRTWVVDRWMTLSYPEMWGEGLRRLVDGVQAEMERAGVWGTILGDLTEAGGRENAVHMGPPPAPAETAE